MRPEDESAQARAIDWLIRQRDPRFDDWDGFADWLAADPGHARLYDEVASLDADLDDLSAAAPHDGRPSVMPVVNERRPSRRAWFGGAIAAALVGALVLPNLDLFGPPSRIETLAGEQRTVELADGSRIEVNGASLVELDDGRPRFARLARGEAMFHIVHRDDAPFVVEVGDGRIVDLGTAFNVVRSDRRTAVSVSEGVVAFAAAGQAGKEFRLTAGEGIEAFDGKAATVGKVDIAHVGGWRNGQLVYDGTPLAQVVEDLRRTAGMRVDVAPNAVDIPFRGALIVDANRERTVADLAALSGTQLHRADTGWKLSR